MVWRSFAWSVPRQLIVRTAGLLFIVGVVPLAGTTCVAADFFKPAKAPPAAMGATGLYPHGGQMAFGLYSVQGNSRIDPKLSNMRRVADAGFTSVGPYYNTNWRDFSSIYSAAAEGLAYTYQIRNPESLGGIPIEQRPAAIDRLTDSQIAANVREQLTAIFDDPVVNRTVARWTSGLEEARYWIPSEMRYLKLLRQTIRAVEQERNMAPRPFWMYEPNNRSAADLKKTGIYQDIVSRGVYMTSMPRGLDRAGNAMWSYGQIVSAAKSLKTTPQAVLQLYEDFSDPLTGTNPAEIRRVIRHDAYLALAMGIKGLNVFSMHENRPNLTTHNDQFLAYASVAQDLTGPLNLEDVFLFGEQRSDLKLAVTRGAKSFNYKAPDGKRYAFPTLNAFSAALGADRYLILVNSTEQPMDVTIRGLPTSYLLDDLFAGTSSAMRQTQFTHRLDVLGVAALRFRKDVAPPLVTFGKGGVGGLAAPEPSTTALVVFAFLAGIAGIRRRRRIT